jgi:hypothetical protein
MSEQQAKEQLAAMLNRFSTGSILHLMSEVLREAAEQNPSEIAEHARESFRDALGTLFVMGLGIDSVWPGRGRGE